MPLRVLITKRLQEEPTCVFISVNTCLVTQQAVARHLAGR
jgi:hypothetical protein